MFEVSGILRSTGTKATVRWHPPGSRPRSGIPIGFGGRGRLSGTPEAIADVFLRLRRREPVRVTATGPDVSPSLATPYAALVTAASVFEDGYEVSGDVPAIATFATPRGAVA